MNLVPQIKELGLGMVLNCILVQKGIRPAMLVQPADYKEATGNDMKTRTILRGIKKYYPELVQSEKYQIHQGIIISKETYNGQSNITVDEMGRILGYPCYKDFSQGGEDDSYAIGIVAISHDEELHLLTNKCKDKTTEKRMIKLAQQAETCFHTYKDLKHIRVKVFIRKNVSVRNLIRKLISKEPFDADDQDEFINTLWNMNGNEQLNEEFRKVIQYDNLVHQGVMLSVLNNTYYNPLSPFFPIQHHREYEQVDHLLLKELHGLLVIFTNTRLVGPKSGTRKKKLAV